MQLLKKYSKCYWLISSFIFSGKEEFYRQCFTSPFPWVLHKGLQVRKIRMLQLVLFNTTCTGTHVSSLCTYFTIFHHQICHTQKGTVRLLLCPYNDKWSTEQCCQHLRVKVSKQENWQQNVCWRRKAVLGKRKLYYWDEACQLDPRNGTHLPPDPPIHPHTACGAFIWYGTQC